MELEIRPLELDELSTVVTIHALVFPDSALMKLGFEAVWRYYEWQIIGPHDAYNIGAFDAQNNLIGFCFGGVFRGALGGFLGKNRSYLIRQVVTHPWLLFNELFRQRVTFAVQRLFGKLIPSHNKANVSNTVQPTSPPLPRAFGILSIAVSPEYQGRGAARLLMEDAEREAIARGFTRMGLSVHVSNARAIRFYEKMGWQKDVVEGTWQGHMSKIISTGER